MIYNICQLEHGKNFIFTLELNLNIFFNKKKQM